VYVDRLVEGEGGERLCLATHPHWFQIARQCLLSLTLLVAALALVLFREQVQRLLAMLAPHLMAPPDAPNADAGASAPLLGVQLRFPGIVAWVALILALAGLLLLGWALLNRHFTEYAITMSPNFGGRIIKVQGVLSRQTVTVPLDMVNNLVLYEPLLGRILGWGNVDIETGNDYEGDRLEYLPNPRAFETIWKTLLDHGYGGHRRGTGRFILDPYLSAGPGSSMAPPLARPGRRPSATSLWRKR
jgi:hypothetical protein